MTDTLDVQGEIAPAELETISPDLLPQAVLSEGPNPFAELGLAPELVAAVTDLGYTEPTAVQLQAIPLALPTAHDGDDHRFTDLMVSSQTGSGKTAAFLLPVITH